MNKLAIVTTHPIQYYAPFFRMLAASAPFRIKVFYTRGRQDKTFDKGFGKEIEWDIPLLDGYEYVFLKNTAKEPGSHHFFGIANPDLIHEVSQWGANAILVFGWSYISHIKALRYFKGKIPVYFRGDSHLLDEQSDVKKHIRHFCLKWVYRYIDYAFYVGTENKKYFLKHGLKEEQLVFAPHAIDNQRFADIEGQYAHKAREWRKQLGISESQIVILFAGKLEGKKNPSLLLQAAKHFKTSSQFAFVFAGNGKMEERLKENAKCLKNVHFVNFQNQSSMPVLYRLCDIFVLPSQGPGETWGLAINEAMACGCPIIVSNKVGCAVDLVKEGDNGYIFENNSLSDLTKKIMLTLPNIKSMGAESYKLIQDWSFDRQLYAFTKSFNIKAHA